MTRSIENPGDIGSKAFSELSVEKSKGVLAEFSGYLMANKKWWLLPIIVSLLMVGVLVVIGGSVAGPFIYTLF